MKVADDIGARALAGLEPDGLDAEGRNWQQRKSILTRIAVLEAAIDCLCEHGYGGATTQLIIEAAGVSRGAMLHHYATRQDLIAAVIDYTFYRRMEIFQERLAAVKDRDAASGSAWLEVLLGARLTREFAAFVELAIAARTDADLAEHFLPRARRFDEAELGELSRAFPDWAGDPRSLAFAVDYCNATIMGLVVNRDIWPDPDQRVQSRFLEDTASLLRSGGLTAPA